MVVHAHNPSIGEVEVGRSEVKGHLWLRSKFEPSLDYMRSCLKTKYIKVFSLLPGIIPNFSLSLLWYRARTLPGESDEWHLYPFLPMVLIIS